LKSATCLALLLAACFVATTASAGTLDRAGTWNPGVYYPDLSPNGPRALINDGSFELGPPPASAWTEVANYPCEWIGDFSSAWYVSSWDGYFDFWAGGYCYDDVSGLNQPSTASVTQSVAVPAGNTLLSFYYVSYRVDPDDEPLDGDKAYAAINGTEIWALPLTQANNTYPSWTGPILVDISAWAGQTVDLTFGGASFGTATGNLRVDYIEFVPGPTPIEETTWGELKHQYR
jgi:hypothetical protein